MAPAPPLPPGPHCIAKTQLHPFLGPCCFAWAGGQITYMPGTCGCCFARGKDEAPSFWPPVSGRHCGSFLRTRAGTSPFPRHSLARLIGQDLMSPPSAPFSLPTLL